MATTYLWSVSAIQVVDGNQGQGGGNQKTYATWYLVGTSSDTYTAYTPSGQPLVTNYSGAASGTVEVNLTVGPSTTEDDANAAVQTALG